MAVCFAILDFENSLPDNIILFKSLQKKYYINDKISRRTHVLQELQLFSHLCLYIFL